MRDYGIISEDKSSQAIGLRKLANERHSYRMARRDQEKDERDVITSLYFDGKKTVTRVMKQNTKTGRLIDYVMIVEPGSQYLSHVTPPSGHWKFIATTIYKSLKEEN